jgi:O-antigen/teichoic acid export membrane protein
MVLADPPPRPRADTTRSLFFRGSAWALFDFGSTQLLRLVSNVILWRLVTPEAFGLMSIVTSVLVGLSMFSDVGIGPSIVQHERGDDRAYLDTAWTIQVIRGTLLAVAVALVAGPVARFYHQPELAPLLVIVALTPLCSAFNSTKLFSAQRRVAIRAVTLIDVSSYVIGTLVMLLVAWLTRSLLALTISGVLQAALRLVFGHLLLPGHRDRLRWDGSAVAELVHFGRWIFLSTALTFLAMSSDRLILGKLLPIGALGVYGIAATWANIPGSILGKVFGNVAMAVLSRVKNRGEEVGPVFRATRERVLLAGAWATSGLIAGAAPLVRLFYDQRAADAIWIIPALAAGGWFAALENSNSSATLALGRPKWLAAANGAKVIGMAVLMPVGALMGGFFGAIVGLAVADLFKYLVSAVGAVRVGVGAWLQDLMLTVGIVALSLATLAVRQMVGADRLPPALDALVVTLLTTGAWGLTSLGALRSRRRAALAGVLPT